MNDETRLSDISLTREQELVMAEYKLLWVRNWIDLLTHKILDIENIILDGNDSERLHSRNDLLKRKFERLKLKISKDIDRILYISSFRHTAIWDDVEYIKSQEKKFIIDKNDKALKIVRLVTIFEDYIDVAWTRFDRFDIEEDGSRVLSIWHTLTIGLLDKSE